MTRPLPDEYPEYYNLYINLIGDGDIRKILESQGNDTQKFFESLPSEFGDKTYAFGKWTIKEVVGHMIDTERIYSARALRIARGDKQPLPGYDQDEYVRNGKFFKRTLRDLADEMLIIRGASLMLFNNLDEEEFLFKGKANDFDFSVRAIMYIIAGHENHHINYIKNNYLNILTL